MIIVARTVPLIIGTNVPLKQRMMMKTLPVAGQLASVALD